MKSKCVVSILVLASLMLGGDAQAVNYVQPEITGAEINKYAEKAPQFVPVQKESKANLVQYKMKDTGGKLELEQANIKVEIPKNIAEPVVLKGKEQANTKAGKKAEDIKITMPQAKGSKVTKEKNGVVGYESKDNFTNIVEPTKEGIRLMTVIENKNAPERYEYKLDIKGGYFLTESFGENGKKGIAVLTADQSDLIAMVDAPWAKDGSGTDIETYYEIKGNTIVQIVKHKVKGTVYPVVADPFIDMPYFGRVYYENWGWQNWGWHYWFNRDQTRKIRNGIGIASEWVTTLGLSSWASWIYDKGSCIGFSNWFSSMWMWEWKNRHCI